MSSQRPHHDQDTQPLLPIAIAPTNKAESNYLSAILSCLMYTGCSIAMVLTNKAIPMTVPSEYRHKLPQISIILAQCIVAVVLVETARILKLVEYQGLSWPLVKQWLPLNFIFIAMLFTGFLSLVYISVPMVTIFKNVTNLFTVFGDWYLFGETLVFSFNFIF